MDESSSGALVPPTKSKVVEPPSAVPRTDSYDGGATAEEIVNDYLCPICMQIMKDVFVTSCGHSYCYMCITTHLRSKNDCPTCGQHLPSNQLFPNFLLDKLLKRACARQVSDASPTEQFRHALEQGCEVSIQELDTLLKVLAEKRRKLEQEEAERNMQILLDFLHTLRKLKLDELNEMQGDLQFVKEDINAVERHRVDLCRAKERSLLKVRMLTDDTSTSKYCSSPTISGLISSAHSIHGETAMGNFQHKKVDGKTQSRSVPFQIRDTSSDQSSEHMSQFGLDVIRKKRVLAKFDDLQECYLQKRRQLVDQPYKQEDDVSMIQREGYSVGLAEFQSVLTAFTRFGRLRVTAELHQGDLLHAANIVSSAALNLIAIMSCLLPPEFQGVLKFLTSLQ